MDAIKRILPLQSGTGAIEYAVVAAGVFLAIAAAVTVRWVALI
jgi:Flp pilus assembly pilin Flp